MLLSAGTSWTKRGRERERTHCLEKRVERGEAWEKEKFSIFTAGKREVEK
jgi:hypothetical protein